MNSEKPLRVIVCGTTFGRVYLRGIERMKDEFELVGILARGSYQAAKCAEEYNVPLYTDVGQLEDNSVDVACVVVRSTVVGGRGTDIASDLLMKGIHVIQEQPVHYDDLLKCLRSAHKSGCCYQINGFYPDIETVRGFITTARQALRKSEAVYIDAACSIHVLFPLVDILGQALEGFRPWSFLPAAGSLPGDPFCSLNGQIKGIPVNLRVQNQLNPDDPDNNTHLLHRIVIGTDSGSLMMTDSYGLVLWSPRRHIPHGEDGILDLYGSNPFLELPVTEPVLPVRNKSFRTEYTGIWPDGIRRSLHRFRETILSGERDNRLVQYQLTACRVWQDIGERLGPARIVSIKETRPLTLSGLQACTAEDEKESK